MAKLPAGVVALGFVSLFMDISSEMIHGLLPVFLVGTLGVSVAVLGLIEGISEATASVTKLFSGLLSDRMGRRKPLAVLGYALSALTKPLFAMAGGAGAVAAARFADRVGKGIRGAPRDALIADLVPEPQRGAAYGLRQSLDTVGAVIGPVLAMVLMVMFAGNVRLVFWLAIIPAAIAVAVLVIYVREPEATAHKNHKSVVRFADIGQFGRGFWGVVVIASMMTLARFSEAFLIIRATDEGLPLALAPLVLVVMNVIYSASAWPSGALSDRIGKTGLLQIGFVMLVLADLVLAFAPGLWAVLIGVALWGLHMGMTQGLLSAQVASVAPVHLRATAFGVFNLITGLVLLAANVLAGGLWAAYGAQSTFLAGAAFASMGVLGLGWIRRQR